MSEMKIGAYICQGCGLGKRLNTASLVSIATKEGKAAIAKQHSYLCNEEGVAMIKQDIAEGVNRVVIAACSRRAKTEAFDFDGIIMARANLREGVIWIRPDTDEAKETTEEMAADYVRMACAEMRYTKPPAPNPAAQYNRNLLVVGGGVTGMTAAIEAANAGYTVTLVEKENALGGTMAKMVKCIPQHVPFTTPEESPVANLVKTVEGNSKITVHLGSRVARTEGAPGRFQIDIQGSSGTQQVTAGAIVQATGFKPFDASQLDYLGFGKSPDVVDALGLEALVKAANGGAIKRPSDGQTVNHVVFVQCAGQRSNKEGELSYCSGHCCLTSIKQAMYFKDQSPEIDTTILFSDLRTPGAGGEDFYRSGQDKGVTFSKGVVSKVEPSGSRLKVTSKDLILDEETTLEADLVVLATGMVPCSGINIDALTAPQVEGEGAANAVSEDSSSPNEESVLNLTYRQGPDIPQLINGFTDSHFICFPYETRRTGIYAAGPVRRPMDSGQAATDAMGATLKAIQAIENSKLGRAAHPRSGDLSFPSFSKTGCTQCKRCTVECPFGAIDEDEQRYPLFNEARCRRCGTCMGACPVRVISFENYSIDTVGQQIKAVEIPDEYSEKPRILILACENDAYPALDMAGQNHVEYSAFVRIIPVRCLGSVNLIWVTDALNSGYDGIMLMGCRKGIEYQCHFVKGSEIAHYRLSKVDDTLKSLNLEPERVIVHEVAITDIHRIPQLINSYVDKINEIGLSPFKF